MSYTCFFRQIGDFSPIWRPGLWLPKGKTQRHQVEKSYDFILPIWQFTRISFPIVHNRIVLAVQQHCTQSQQQQQLNLKVSFTFFQIHTMQQKLAKKILILKLHLQLHFAVLYYLILRLISLVTTSNQLFSSKFLL